MLLVDNIKECIELYEDKAWLFRCVQQPHICHLKTFSQINAFLWFVLWISKDVSETY